MVTAYAMLANREDLQTGFDGYLSKPLEFSELHRIIEERTRIYNFFG